MMRCKTTCRSWARAKPDFVDVRGFVGVESLNLAPLLAELRAKTSSWSKTRLDGQTRFLENLSDLLVQVRTLSGARRECKTEEDKKITSAIVSSVVNVQKACTVLAEAKYDCEVAMLSKPDLEQLLKDFSGGLDSAAITANLCESSTDLVMSIVDTWSGHCTALTQALNDVCPTGWLPLELLGTGEEAESKR